MSNTPETRKVQLASGLSVDLLVKGKGDPLFFLHPAHGRQWSAFLDGLAEHYTVYAPLTPGGDEPDELMQLDAFSDLALFYDDLFNALNIGSAVVVGHAFGGMVAAEFAAYCPNRVSTLVLINAMGLWIDETPVADIHSTHPKKLPALLFTDPEGPVAKFVLEAPRPEERGAFWLAGQLSQGAATHFYWPIPDRDLKRRLYRISSPTLLLWGANDRVVPTAYADAFAAGIGNSRKVIIQGAAHFPHLEKTDEVVGAITGFVKDGVRKLETAR